MVTSIGTGREQFWKNVLAGRSGTSAVESFDTSAFNVHLGAEVKDFCATDYVMNLDAAHRRGETSFG